MDWAALLSAVAALVAATASWRTNGKVRSELTHNHGSSMKDALARIEVRQTKIAQAQDSHEELSRSMGHQIGEIRDDARQIHADHSAPIRNLECRL